MYRSIILDESPATIADIGCGVGLNIAVTRLYTGGRTRLIGVDKDAVYLEAMKTLYPEALAIQADALNLPLRDGSIDIAFATGLLHELPNLGVIGEVKRVLRHGGRAVIGDAVVRRIPRILLSLARVARIKARKEPETPYTMKQIIRRLCREGFSKITTIVSWRGFFSGALFLLARKPR